VKAKKRKKATNRQAKWQARLANKGFTSPSEPLLGNQPIRYELADRTRVISMGGIGALHTLVMKLRLPEILNKKVSVLKRHLPYWESDHILSQCYNLLTGGQPLQDLNRLRLDEGYLEALGVERLPAPSTAGDFLRRFEAGDLVDFQEAINQARQTVWQRMEGERRRLAILDLDGTITPTAGECKQGMDYCAYKKQWGYGPLLISLAQTREVLYVVNRPASVPSHHDAAVWVKRALLDVRSAFETIWLRGDSDFSLTKEFDGWDEEEVMFLFGYDAHANLIEQAQQLPSSAWEWLERPPPYEIKTTPRTKPDHVKQEIVEYRGFERIETVCEEVASFAYRPTACKKTYRMIVLRKQLEITTGGQGRREEIVYFFYITNDWMSPVTELLLFYDERGGQEHLIGQLKSTIPVFHAPTDTLEANGAYMIIAALAWNLKIWYGLLLEEPALQQQIQRLSFTAFLERFIHVPCQILTSGRRLIYRIVQFTTDTLTALSTFEQLIAWRFP
jgi:hypothetical protein